MNEEDVRLKLLQDLPVCSEGDLLDYKTYAGTLRQVFESVGSGASIGLFGRWGQGKSSVVNMLEDQPPRATKVAVFNAWQSQGDSVRRQMLLALVEAIRPAHVGTMKKFFGLSVACLPEDRSPCPKFSLTQLWNDVSRDWRVKWCLVGSAALLAVAGYCFHQAFKTPDANAAFIALATSCCLPAMVPFAAFLFSRLGARYRVEVNSGQQSSESLRFEYPEQFRDEFVKHIAAYLAGEDDYDRVLFVVDDLDRCDAGTVAEALSAIRQFSGRDRAVDCQFLVPCDEKQVVLALERAGHDVGENGARCHDDQNEELLRKFFDVVVRMDAPLQQDMVHFAAKLVAEGAIDLTTREAQEVTALAGARDPREVKKLLNALVVAKSKRQRSANLLPGQESLAHLAETERLLVVLREKAPLAFERLGADPSLLEARFPEEDRDEWRRMQYKKANQILDLSPRISVPTATALIYGRVDPEIRGVKCAGPLMNAVASDNVQAFETSMQSVVEAEQADVQQWLCRKTRECRTPTEARRLMNHFINFGYVDANGKLAFIEPCISALTDMPRVPLDEVMVGFKRHNFLETMLPAVSESIAQVILGAVHSSFAKGDHKNHDELKLLIRLADLVPEQARRELEEWLINAVLDGKDALGAARIAQLLPVEARPAHVYGRFPRASKALAENWGKLASPKAGSDGSPPAEYGRLILEFAGDDEAAVVSCLGAMFDEQGGILATPEAVVPESDQHAAGALQTACKLMCRLSQSQLGKVDFCVAAWYEVQSDPEVVALVLLGAALKLPEMEDAVVAQFAKQTAEWLVESEDLVNVAAAFPSADALAGERRRQWSDVADAFISALASGANASTRPTPATKSFCSGLEERGWVALQAPDGLLAQVVETQVAGFLSEWADILAPLSASWPTTRQRIRDTFSETRDVGPYFSLGLRTAWAASVDDEGARTLAQVLMERFEECSATDEFEALWVRSGCTAVLDAIAVQLRPHDADWLAEHQDLLTFLAGQTGTHDRAGITASLCEALEVLRTSSDDDNQALALCIGAKMKVATPAFAKHVKQLRKNESKAWEEAGKTEMLENAKTIAGLPTLGHRHREATGDAEE